MMLKTRADLTRRAKLDDLAAATAAARVAKSINLLYRNYIAQVRAFVKNPQNFSKAETFEVALLVKSEETLREILETAGVDDTIATHLDQFIPLTVKSRQYFTQFGDLPKLGGSSAEALDAYIGFSERQLRTYLDRKLIAPMQEALFQGTFGRLDRNSVISTVESIAESLTSTQAETLVDDTYRQYQRAVTNLTADELGLEIYWYQGPDDERTSPQCNAILNEAPHGVPGMYYRDEISQDMHPDLDADPFVAGGHFNCRHKFYPVTLEFAKSQGFMP